MASFPGRGHTRPHPFLFHPKTVCVCMCVHVMVAVTEARSHSLHYQLFDKLYECQTNIMNGDWLVLPLFSPIINCSTIFDIEQQPVPL